MVTSNSDNTATRGITFQASFERATTPKDGGWVITFAVSEDEANAVMQLSQMRGTLLQLGIVPLGSSPALDTITWEDMQDG